MHSRSGDWLACMHAMMKFFKNKQKNSKKTIQVREVGSNAPWRSQPMSHWEVLQRIIDNGRPINPILQVPWVDVEICRIDWLHCSDKGVAAEFVGNALTQLQAKFPETTIAARVKSLSDRMLAYYKANRVEDKLDCLMPNMFYPGGKKADAMMHCSAAQCKALVPFVAQCANEMLSDNNPVEKAVKMAAQHLKQVYDTLSESSFLSADVARSEGLKFALQYVALHDVAGTEKRWKIKPKLHLWLHMISDGSKPSRYWNYRDEDYGGSVAKLSRRRGGLQKPGPMSRNVLMRFLVKQPLVRMR